MLHDQVPQNSHVLIDFGCGQCLLRGSAKQTREAYGRGQAERATVANSTFLMSCPGPAQDGMRCVEAGERATWGRGGGGFSVLCCSGHAS